MISKVADGAVCMEVGVGPSRLFDPAREAYIMPNSATTFIYAVFNTAENLCLFNRRVIKQKLTRSNRILKMLRRKGVPLL